MLFISATDKDGTLAKSNYQYEKRQRELARKKKKEDKRQRKLDRRSPEDKNDREPGGDE